MPLSPSDIKDFIAFGREQAGIEFKSAGSLSDPGLRGKVIRGMLAMGNRRDGGIVLIGVTESASGPKLDGLTREQADSWKHDTLADNVAVYADPRLAFDSYSVEVDNHLLVAIVVEEFPDVPVICKRSLGDGRNAPLRDGAVYVRSNRKPESREIANFDEMRELLEVAVDKGVRRFVSRAQAGGLNVATSSVSSADSYRTERGSL